MQLGLHAEAAPCRFTGNCPVGHGIAPTLQGYAHNMGNSAMPMPETIENTISRFKERKCHIP